MIIVSFLRLMRATFDEALKQRRNAQRLYPYLSWED